MLLRTTTKKKKSKSLFTHVSHEICGRKAENCFYGLEAFEEHWNFPHITIKSQRTTMEFKTTVEIMYTTMIIHTWII